MKTWHWFLIAKVLEVGSAFVSYWLMCLFYSWWPFAGHYSFWGGGIITLGIIAGIIAVGIVVWMFIYINWQWAKNKGEKE